MIPTHMQVATATRLAATYLPELLDRQGLWEAAEALRTFDGSLQDLARLVSFLGSASLMWSLNEREEVYRSGIRDNGKAICVLPDDILKLIPREPNCSTDLGVYAAGCLKDVINRLARNDRANVGQNLEDIQTIFIGARKEYEATDLRARLISQGVPPAEASARGRAIIDIEALMYYPSFDTPLAQAYWRLAA